MSSLVEDLRAELARAQADGRDLKARLALVERDLADARALLEADTLGASAATDARDAALARLAAAEESAALWQRSAEAHRAEVVETRKSRDHWRDCEERQRAATDAAVAHAEELTRALSSALLKGLDLRAIIEGRTVAPTRTEIAVHAARGGRWRTTYHVGDPALCGDLLGADAAERLATAQRARPLHAYTWWATEACGDLCPWPAPEAPRV